MALTKVGSGVIQDDAVGIANLGATGTASSSTFLRGDNAWATAGGLTAASQWRLTAAFNGGLSPIAANLEQVDAPAGFGVLGSSMTESSGVFTFPSTGYWLIRFNPLCKVQDGWPVTYIYAKIVTTDDDSTWVEAARASQMKNVNSSPTANTYVSCSLEYIFDVVSTSTHKVQFWINPSGNGVDTQGDSGYNETHMTFLRLADT